MEKLKDKELLKELNRRGYFTIKREISQDVEYNFPRRLKSFKVGVVSDSHLGNIYQQLTFLKHFYQYCAKQGITDILHAGDLIDGNGKLYRGHIYELFQIGAKNQLKYAVKNYPKLEGITTYVIGGN